MRKKALFSFLVIAILFCGTLGTFGQDRNRISGFVFDESRRPLSDIYVELQDDFYSTISRVRTSGSGMFNFAGLPSGRYVVKVLSTGTNYEEQSVSVALVPVSAVAGRGVVFEQVDVYLRPKKTRGVPMRAAGVIYVQEVPSAAKALYEAGLNDLENKRDAEGFEKIKRAIEEFPDYYLALDTLGNEYVNREHYEAAYILLAKALSVNSRSFSSTLGLGLAAFRLGRSDDALARFQEAARLDKKSANAHLWLGIVYHARGDLGRAVRSIKESAELAGEGVPEIHWQLARVLNDQKK
ncbi:MAG: carboxypeptidase regulatory-like domain-containing protein, partial [Blastocatellia bacterium]|nr:carboxypeptidase regulatory-like domain-containing protein [Blastocatellia bacterium]